jgi:beta-glucanase (GH16 family)
MTQRGYFPLESFILFFFTEISRTRQLTKIFRDDFNDQSVDAEKWTISTGYGSHDIQYFTLEDVYEEGGKMFIRSQRRKHSGRDFTSGRVLSAGKFEFLYGEVEWRAKLPQGRGIDSALFINFAGAPGISFRGRGDSSDMIRAKVYYMSHQRRNDSRFYDIFGADDTLGNFHYFKIIWEPNEIIWLVDGHEKFRITDFDQIPHQKAYLNMQVNVGTVWTGAPDITTPRETRMLIDYVTVHQWK